MNSTIRFVIPLLVATLGLAACGDDSGDGSASGGGGTGGQGTGGGGGEADVDAEACEHFADGPFNEVAATAMPDDGAAIDEEHTSHDITLVDGGDGTYSGFVAFNAPETGGYFFFVSEDAPVSFETAGGDSVATTDACDGSASCSDACSGIVQKLEVELEVGTHYIELGPTESETVAIVHEEEGAHVGE